MREFAFDLVFDRGVDPLADLFVRRTELRARSLAAPADPWFWRLDQVTGPSDVLQRAESLRDGPEPVGFAAAPESVETHHDCIERGAERHFYSYVVDEGGRTVPGLIADHLDPGVVVETTRRDDRQHWRLLVRDGTTVGGFHDALVERLHDGVAFRMGYLRDATQWQDHVAAGELPAEQRRALRAAVEAGYYESPRAATLDEIADRIGIPRSTFSYRLRNAESRLVRAYVAGDERGAPGTPDEAP